MIHNGIYSTPCDTVNADNGTITTAAVPEMTPDRPPINGAVIPITTDDHRPTSGLTPTMAEQAMALDRRENATVSPASPSWIFEDEVVVDVVDVVATAEEEVDEESSSDEMLPERYVFGSKRYL